MARTARKMYSPNVSRGASRMSRTITCIGPENPSYYSDILQNITSRVDRHSPSQRSCQTIPGIQNIDDTLTRRLQSVLDDIARISLCEKGNVSATMACLKQHDDVLQTQLYVVFNHQRDESHRLCRQHLETTFTMLRNIPYKPSEANNSPQLITNDLMPGLPEICKEIIKHSFGIFTHHVVKRRDEMPRLKMLICQGTGFKPKQHSILLTFLQEVETIIKFVDEAEEAKQFSIIRTRLLLGFYSSWMKNRLLPKDDDDTTTLLDAADRFLESEAIRNQNDSHCSGFTFLI